MRDSMAKLNCGCEENAGTMGTMVRIGNHGYGHYAQDGDFMGKCVQTPTYLPALDTTDEQLDEFIEEADKKISYGEEWWLDDFFQEAKVIAEELKAWRALDASNHR